MTRAEQLAYIKSMTDEELKEILAGCYSKCEDGCKLANTFPCRSIVENEQRIREAKAKGNAAVRIASKPACDNEGCPDNSRDGTHRCMSIVPCR